MNGNKNKHHLDCSIHNPLEHGEKDLYKGWDGRKIKTSELFTLNAAMHRGKIQIDA